MKLHLIAVGRLRKGPELAMVEDYLDRFAKVGRGLGLPSVTVVELDARGAGMATEARGSFIERNVMLGRQLVSRAHARNTATNNGNALALHRGGIK